MGWLIAGPVTQTVVVLAIRTQKIPFLQRRPAATPLVTTSIVIACGILIPMGPSADNFKLQAPPPEHFPVLAAILLGHMAPTRTMKNLSSRRFGWR